MRNQQTRIYENWGTETIFLIVTHSFQFCPSLNFKLFDLVGSFWLGGQNIRKLGNRGKINTIYLNNYGRANYLMINILVNVESQFI